MLAVVLALALEQWRPAPRLARSGIDSIAAELPGRLDGGSLWQAWLGWALFAGGAAAGIWLAGWLLGSLAGVLEGLFIVGVLYLTLGFRVFSSRFRAVRDGLAARRLDLAGAALARWQGSPLAAAAGEMPASTPATIARRAIERGVGEAGRWLFGPVFWFVLLPGASGAALYRAADRLSRCWLRPPVPARHPRFAEVALQARRWLDLLPARLAASAFALVGDFTGAVEGWQGAVREQPGQPQALAVAAALGALGMGGAGTLDAAAPGAAVGAGGDPFDGAGWDADAYAVAVRQMDSAAALVWRSLLVWLAGLALLAIAL